MTDEREVWFTDRYGVSIEDGISVEAFARIFDALSGGEADDEHSVVAIDASDGWNVEFSADSVFLGQVEAGGEELGEMTLSDREHALTIARAFLEGDFAALREMPWQP